jgi:hypothetical protein
MIFLLCQSKEKGLRPSGLGSLSSRLARLRSGCPKISSSRKPFLHLLKSANLNCPLLVELFKIGMREMTVKAEEK